MRDRAQAGHRIPQALQLTAPRAAAHHEQVHRLVRLREPPYRFDERVQIVPRPQAPHEPDHPLSVQAMPCAQRRSRDARVEALRAHGVRQDEDPLLGHAEPPGVLREGPRHDEDRVRRLEDRAFQEFRGSPQHELAVSLLLPRQRRVDLQQVRHPESPREFDPGVSPEGVALVDHVRPEGGERGQEALLRMLRVEQGTPLLGEVRGPHRRVVRQQGRDLARESAQRHGVDVGPLRRRAAVPAAHARRVHLHGVAEPAERRRELLEMNGGAARAEDRHPEVGAQVGDSHLPASLASASSRSARATAPRGSRSACVHARRRSAPASKPARPSSSPALPASPPAPAAA